jgi:type II secretory pathway pseudopilin PulG
MSGPNFFSAVASRRAFTLVEALVASAITAMAGAALLLGVATSMDATDENLEMTIAMGMAQQLMDEISAQQYMQPGTSPNASYLGPDAGETAGPGRTKFNDIDDYNGLQSQPPKDRWGITLSTGNGLGGQRPTNFQSTAGYFSRWHQRVTVYYVNDTDFTSPMLNGSTSYHKTVQIQILVDDPVRGPMVRATLTQVFSYVPQP